MVAVAGTEYAIREAHLAAAPAKHQAPQGVKRLNGQVKPPKLRLSRAATAAGQRRDAAEESLEPGEPVEAFGLSKLGQLNGQVGNVQGKDPQNSRYVVAFNDHSYALKRQNLRVALLAQKAAVQVD